MAINITKRRRQICSFLDEMKKEEQTAKEVYKTAKRRFPHEASKIDKILGEKMEHARTFGRLFRKYNCKQ